MIYLLDANILIASTVLEHEHHDRVAGWLTTVERVAVCPIVEGALIRFLIRIGTSIATAQEVLRGLRSDPRCEFWPDDVSYADADLDHVRGHGQVTDAYLVALVARHPGSLLATLDEGLRRDRPELTLLVPTN